MSDHTKPRPTWVIASLELLNERLDAALSWRAFHAQAGNTVQAADSENDAADYRRQIAEWKARYGLEEDGNG